MLLTNSETFLSEMSKLFYTNQTNGGSIYITMKRINLAEKKPKPRPPGLKSKKNVKKGKKQSQQQQQQQSKDQSTSTPATTTTAKDYKCLIRVFDRKHKISTIVSAKDVNKFQQAYSNLLKGNLYGLKKKDKKKAMKKSKATQ